MSPFLIAGIIVLVAMIAVAISVVGRARRLAVQNEVIPDDELAEFKRMRDAGEISEEEYRKMKKVIAEKTVEKAKGS